MRRPWTSCVGRAGRRKCAKKEEKMSEASQPPRRRGGNSMRVCPSAAPTRRLGRPAAHPTGVARPARRQRRACFFDCGRVECPPVSVFSSEGLDCLRKCTQRGSESQSVRRPLSPTHAHSPGARAARRPARRCAGPGLAFLGWEEACVVGGRGLLSAERGPCARRRRRQRAGVWRCPPAPPLHSFIKRRPACLCVCVHRPRPWTRTRHALRPDPPAARAARPGPVLTRGLAGNRVGFACSRFQKQFGTTPRPRATPTNKASRLPRQPPPTFPSLSNTHQQWSPPKPPRPPSSPPRPRRTRATTPPAPSLPHPILPH
jgi:hypothetical protein